MEIKGKYGTAVVYASVVDDTTKEQIKNLMDQKFTKDLNVRIMADCHAGTGCVLDCVVPNLVGVDIGCGMLTVKLGKMDIDLIKLDRFVRKKIPSGLETYKEEQELENEGHIALYLIKNNKIIALVGLKDIVRANAKKLVSSAIVFPSRII